MATNANNPKCNYCIWAAVCPASVSGGMAPTEQKELLPWKINLLHLSSFLMEFPAGQDREQILQQCLWQNLSRAAGTRTSPECPSWAWGLSNPISREFIVIFVTKLPSQRDSWSTQGISPWPGGFQHPLALAASLWLSLNSCLTLGNVYPEKKGFNSGRAKRLFRRGMAGSAWDSSC